MTVKSRLRALYNIENDEATHTLLTGGIIQNQPFTFKPIPWHIEIAS